MINSGIYILFYLCIILWPTLPILSVSQHGYCSLFAIFLIPAGCFHTFAVVIPNAAKALCNKAHRIMSQILMNDDRIAAVSDGHFVVCIRDLCKISKGGMKPNSWAALGHRELKFYASDLMRRITKLCNLLPIPVQLLTIIQLIFYYRILSLETWL